jgi:methyltransferase family protein
MMDWRLKCLALHALSRAPHGLYAGLQRRSTARYFLKLTAPLLAAFGYHVENFRKVGGRALEFGAGRNLVTALLLSNAGADEVLAYDLARLATVELVNRMIAELRTWIPGDWPGIADLGDDLRRRYRIRYLAPGDARCTGLEPGNVDFICSTSTLEHIAPTDIAAILGECQRIASPRALFSFLIDYHDHYCTADPRITRVNFYKYSDFTWQFLNPSNHYQNRLRHSDYERLFAACGLEALESRAVVPEIEVDTARIAARFRHYSRRDLMALNGFFQLRPARQGA